MTMLRFREGKVMIKKLFDAYILCGDGKGNFKKTYFAEGPDFQEAKVLDLDGVWLPDIVAKPQDYGLPRVDIFMNLGLRGTANDQS
jgi:hypothetical protein